MTTNDNWRKGAKILLGAGFLGATGVMAGAFGAHALRERLAAADLTDVWRTAVEYQLWHALALLALGLAAGAENSFFVRAAGLGRGAAWCWGVGVGLFSGSLYALSLDGPRWLGPVTPLGGALLIAGWMLVIAAAWRARKG